MVPAAAVAAAAAIVTAGCASAGASGPGSLDGAAAIVPSNAVAFVAASTDLGSERWHGVGKQLMTKFQSLAPALGDELDVAVLPSKAVVGFTQPQDSAKLTALATKYGAVTRAIGGWTAIAKTSADLDTVANATSHLADNALFTEAMNRLPDGSLMRAYANGDQAQQLLSSIPGQLQTSLAPAGMHYRISKARVKTYYTVATTGFRWVAAAVTSTADGLKLEAFTRTGALTSPGPPRFIVHQTPPYVSALVDEIPSGALAVADFQVPTGTFENLPQLPAPLVQLFGAKNVEELGPQLDTLLGGETAIYVRPSLPIPEVTIVTQPADTTTASQTLDAIVAELPKTSMFSGLHLYRTTIGGQFVISTTQQGLDDFRAGGAKLSADPSFVEAKQQSGMGNETTGFVYANVKATLPLLALAGVKLPAALPSFGTFMAYGGEAGADSSLTAFLGVSSS
jgi:hypothetical protein